jgi:hypothetical protein
MKEITIGNRTLQFAVLCEANEADSYEYTEFYEGTKTATRKKWLLWGKTITTEKPKLVFTIYNDITSTKLTKEYWRTEISKKLELLDRRDQIERGEYI